MTQEEWDTSWDASSQRIWCLAQEIDEFYADHPEPKDKKLREEVRKKREKLIQPVRTKCVLEHNARIELNVLKQKGLIV